MGKIMTKTFDCIVILPVKKTARSAREIRDKVDKMMSPYDGHFQVKPYLDTCFCVRHGHTIDCKVCKGTGWIWTRRNPKTKYQSYGTGRTLSESLAAIFETPTRMGYGDLFLGADIYKNASKADPALLAAMNLKPEAIMTPDGLWHDDVDAILADWPKYSANICVILTCTV